MLYYLKNNNIPCAMELLDFGANGNVCTSSGNNALKMFMNKKDNTTLETLLTKYKADPNIRDYRGRTPLHYLVSELSSDIVACGDMATVLIQNGADVNAVDELGRIPLNYAFIKINEQQNN